MGRHTNTRSDRSTEVSGEAEVAGADLSAGTWDSMRDDLKAQSKTTTVDFPNPETVEKGSTVPIGVNVEGTNREIFMHVPKNYDASKPAPVLIVYNGWGDKPGPGNTKAGAAGLEDLTGLSKAADAEGFFVLYMNGNPKKDLSFNNGQYPFSKTNDVNYTTAVLDKLNANYNIDLERLTLTGYSQGSSFAHKAAAELPEKYRPANLVDVSGWTTGKEKPVPEGMNFMSIQSHKDTVAPIDGRWFGLHMDSEEKTLQRYLKGNGITDVAKAVELKRESPEAPQVVEHTWAAANGASIKSISIEGFAGHDWHGGAGSEAPVNATQELMKFIRGRRRPNS